MLSVHDLVTPLDLATATNPQFERADHLELLQDEFLATLGGDFDVLIAMAPPRHGKSWFLARECVKWYQSVHPTKFSILSSYQLDLARDHSVYVRDEVHRWAKFYGHAGVKRTQSSATSWRMDDLRHGGERIPGGGCRAAGVGGGITGRGADLFVIDDYLKNSEQATSERIRNKQWEWFQTTAWTRREPGGVLVCLATRWHEDDLIGRMLKFFSESNFKVREIRLPALAEPTPEHPDPLGRQTGEALWPERWSAEYLEKQRDLLDPYWFEAMFQQRLGTYGKNEWPSEYFYGIYAQDDEWPEPHECALSITALDPSKGRNSKSGDYSAIANVAFKDGYLWIDIDMDRRPVPKMMSDLVSFNSIKRPLATIIEGNAFQDLLAPDYEQAQIEMGNYRDEPVLVENKVSKELRIRRLGFWLRIHRLKIKRNRGGELLLEQLKYFPNAEHDDGPDAVEMAIRHLLLAVDDPELQGLASGDTTSLTV